jgi:hypothetical protein
MSRQGSAVAVVRHFALNFTFVKSRSAKNRATCNILRPTLTHATYNTYNTCNEQIGEELQSDRLHSQQRR